MFDYVSFLYEANAFTPTKRWLVQLHIISELRRYVVTNCFEYLPNTRKLRRDDGNKYLDTGKDAG